jgi:hypothetical protein
MNLPKGSDNDKETVHMRRKGSEGNGRFADEKDCLPGTLSAVPGRQVSDSYLMTVICRSAASPLPVISLTRYRPDSSIVKVSEPPAGKLSTALPDRS